MKHNNRDKIFILMILPAFIGFIILFIVPSAMSFIYSFTNWSVYKQNVSFIGIQNYFDLFKDLKTLRAIQNSIKYAITITVLQNVLAIFFAVILSKKVMMSKVLKSIFFLPAVISILVVAYLFQYIMTSADYGLLNNIIRYFGGDSINWLGDPKLALYSVLATQVWQWTGWAMVVYIANLKSIDISLLEASNIDGASKKQTFFNVMLPLLYPATSFNVLMSLIGGLKVFDAVFAMTKGGPGTASETIMTTLIREGFNNSRNAYACAFAVVFFVIVFVISKGVTYLLNRWEDAIA